MKKTTKKFRRPLTVRAMLNQIERYLLNSPRDRSRALWDILTALRGPDDGDEQVKDAATIPIRRAAFPKLAELMIGLNPTGALFHRWNSGGAHTPYVEPTDAATHFRVHATQAARALGLIP